MKFGLKDSYLKELGDILQSLPHIDHVNHYGSRARGDYHTGSDIDICLYGDAITDKDLTHLSTMLYDSRIPYFFDVAVWQRIRNKDFAQNIQRDGIEIYKKNIHD